MNLDSSAPAIGFLAFSRSITASTDEWNLDCSSARFFSSGERFLETSASSIIARLAIGGALAATPATPLPCPPPPPPGPCDGFDFATLDLDRVTVTVCAIAAEAGFREKLE